ncbi:sensor domain-containing diguanylate cyclase [Hylemonella gracilis]|uniref:Sensor domain-containing diguanylate cyclase n=1 Tax=Hylemonella gracilis TaxID=80880 RepID=A0A4P6UGP6_9BURK|nr:sensor domain-containing diguanylate cyclase [Hylemonella gracilis]QBK03454.1 sensor domain-containing diguanylate cyclase [Hylemonella gracilis]
MDPILDRLATSVAAARSVEELTRPLLELLQAATGLESTYLTMVDLQQGVQNILFSRNTGRLDMQEGLVVPWDDALCKRALESGQFFVDDADVRWPEAGAVRHLGVRTYMSTPVYLDDGVIYGTLCAASLDQRAQPAQAQRLLKLFAALIARQIEREQLVAQLLQANARLTAYATTDPLTTLSNRRALLQELARQLAQGKRQKFWVLVAFIDLDGFKAINDQHGHGVGDQFLVEMANRLKAVLRVGDFAARLGGDEFVVVGQGPADAEVVEEAQQAFQARVFGATVGPVQMAAITMDYAGASVGVLAVEPGQHDPEEVLQRADVLMYQTKAARRAQI